MTAPWIDSLKVPVQVTKYPQVEEDLDPRRQYDGWQTWLEQRQLELRFNPNHGKDGKFAGGGGGPKGGAAGGAGDGAGGGKGGAGGGGGTVKQLRDDEQTTRDVFEYRDDKTGLTAKVTDISGHGQGHRDELPIYVELEVKNSSGQTVGGITRILRPPGEKTVHADGMMLDKGVQGQGFASRYNAKTEAAMKAHGVKRVTVDANLDVGGYSNARMGYDFRDAGSRKDVARRFNKYKSFPIQDEIDRVASDPNATPIEFAMVGHTPGATSWYGKSRMLESDWYGVKTL